MKDVVNVESYLFGISGRHFGIFEQLSCVYRESDVNLKKSSVRTTSNVNLTSGRRNFKKFEILWNIYKQYTCEIFRDQTAVELCARNFLLLKNVETMSFSQFSPDWVYDVSRYEISAGYHPNRALWNGDFYFATVGKIVGFNEFRPRPSIKLCAVLSFPGLYYATFKSNDVVHCRFWSLLLKLPWRTRAWEDNARL